MSRILVILDGAPEPPLVVAGPDVPAGGTRSLTERAVAGAPVEHTPFLAGALA